MAILTFPSLLVPSRSAWGLKSNTETFTSPLNGTTQTVARVGSRWKATLEFSGLTLDQGAELDAFLASLNGRSGRFNLYPHHRKGTTGAGVVSGGSQGGTTLQVSGYPSNTLIFKAGDFFSVNGELKMMTGPATSTAGGIAFLNFTPPLRATPPNLATVVGTMPSCVMMLDSDEYLVGRGPEKAYDSIVIACTEALT